MTFTTEQAGRGRCCRSGCAGVSGQPPLVVTSWVRRLSLSAVPRVAPLCEPAGAQHRTGPPFCPVAQDRAASTGQTVLSPQAAAPSEHPWRPLSPPEMRTEESEGTATFLQELGSAQIPFASA